MEEQLSELTTYANALWVLVSAALVFFMHAGFALVESGFCRRKNAVMVLMKNFGVVAISSLIFYLVGYGVMFGEGNAFMGLASFFPNNGGADADLPPYVFLFFQLVFAATACTIVSGAIAERGRLLTFFLFTGSGAAAGFLKWASSTSQAARSFTASAAVWPSQERSSSAHAWASSCRTAPSGRCPRTTSRSPRSVC